MLIWMYHQLLYATTGASHLPPLSDQRKADLARAFEEAIVDVLVAKAMAALDETGLSRLVVAGGVGHRPRQLCQIERIAFTALQGRLLRSRLRPITQGLLYEGSAFLCR